MIEVVATDEVGVDVASIEQVLAWAADRLEIPSASVGVMVVGPERMARINHEHRRIDRATDVLAFPLDGQEDLDEWPAEGPPPVLGDVVICPDAADEPLTTLAIHGLLHLLGHDHETDDGTMLAIQDELVAAATAGR